MKFSNDSLFCMSSKCNEGLGFALCNVCVVGKVAGSQEDLERYQ